jgi:predicted dehydrogenase
MSLKFAVIGTGMMGCEHIRNLAHMPDVELVAIADPNQTPSEWALKACGDRFSPAVYPDYRDLVKEDIEAVIIATPNFTHLNVVRDIMDTGMHILLEKPMCTTMEDCGELVQISDERDALTWIALEYRYMSATEEFLRRLGDIGELKMMFIREHRFPFLRKVDNWNRFNRLTGGTLVEKCCHFFDLMNLAIGAQPVYAMASGGQDVNHLDESYGGEKPDILDNAYVIVDYDNGVRACLDLCMFAEGSPNEQELTATGSLGKLEVKIPDNTCSLYWRDDREPESSIVAHNPAINYMGYHHGASFLEIRDFIDAITNQRSATVTTRDGYNAVAVAIAAQESIKTGSRVEISTAPSIS